MSLFDLGFVLWNTHKIIQNENVEQAFWENVEVFDFHYFKIVSAGFVIDVQFGLLACAYDSTQLHQDHEQKEGVDLFAHKLDLHRCFEQATEECIQDQVADGEDTIKRSQQARHSRPVNYMPMRVVSCKNSHIVICHQYQQ